MKKMMDEISFHNLGRNGKQTVMVKYPEKERIDHCSEIEKTDNAASVAQGNLFRMRDFSDKDAIGISQCAYLAYGYSYEAYIYYPSKIREMNQAGTMRSFVAQSNGNTIVGHMALKFDNNPNCAEMGVGVVSPEFRGKQIFDSLLAYALDRAKTMIELKSIYSRCVSSHPYSQKVALKSNFSPTGIQLALFPADVDFKSLSGKVSQKDSAVVITLNTSSNEPAQSVYLPENHKTVVQKIFESLKLDVAWKTPIPPEDEPTDEVVLNSSIMEVFNTGDIYCLSYNSQTFHAIRQALRRLCLEKLDVIYLHLDMTHPSMPHVADQCEKLGFFFSNVLPFGTNGNHALVYQYLNNLNIDFDLIQVADAFSQFLKNYIANCYQQSILK